MSIYDNESKRHLVGIRLTNHQQQKLKHICELFGISYQRLLTDMLDGFYVEMLDVQSGRINIRDAIKISMLSLIDDYIRLKEIKGLVPKPYTRI